MGDLEGDMTLWLRSDVRVGLSPREVKLSVDIRAWLSKNANPACHPSEVGKWVHWFVSGKKVGCCAVCRDVSRGSTPARVHTLPRGSRHSYDTLGLCCLASTESAVTDKRCDSYSSVGRTHSLTREGVHFFMSSVLRGDFKCNDTI